MAATWSPLDPEKTFAWPEQENAEAMLSLGVSWLPYGVCQKPTIAAYQAATLWADHVIWVCSLYSRVIMLCQNVLCLGAT